MSIPQQFHYLHASLQKCAVCGTPCTSSCGACKKVGYCSKNHQQNHWKSHKPWCFPLILKTSTELGRHLVTTRDVKQGEIILKESPIFSGPHICNDYSQELRSNRLVCLSCFRLVQTDFKCSKCDWPLCGTECEKDEQHTKLECKVFSQGKIRPSSIFKTTPSYEIYQGVTVLRGVLQMELNPLKWSKILDLQSHAKERSEIENARRIRNSVIHFVRQLCGQIQCQEEQIDHVLGAIGVNAFVSDDGVSEAMLYRNGTYLCHIASMPAHNCVPNSSWVIQLNSDFHLRAAVPIKCGESVNFLYTEATLGTYERRKKLQESKYFLCRCPRCLDPTELKTYLSGVKCHQRECVGGYLLPDQDFRWSCEKCPCKKSPDFVRYVLEQIDVELLTIDQGDSFLSVEKLLKISHKHSGVTLHPNNSKLHDVENDALQRISFLLMQQSRVKNKQIKNTDVQWAKKLVELSKKYLTILDVIWPGYNRQRGRLLYFLQQGLLIVLLDAAFSSKSKSTSPQDLAQLKQVLQQVMEIRKQVLDIFSVEPEGREESYIAKAIANNPPEILRLKSLLR